MEKTVIKKAVLIGGLSALLLGVVGVGLDLRLKKELGLKRVYIAARKIPPRSEITEADMEEIYLPQAYVFSFMAMEKEEILGMYTDIQGCIPAGSPFYRDMLFKAEQLPDHPMGMLREGQVAYTMEVDMTRLGGNVVAGQRVDIYASFDLENHHVLTGCLLQHVRIISIRDHKGLELDEEGSTKTPYMAILAVGQNEIELLSAAEQRGSLRLFVSNETYDTQLEASRPSDSEVVKYLEGLQMRERAEERE